MLVTNANAGNEVALENNKVNQPVVKTDNVINDIDKSYVNQQVIHTAEISKIKQKLMRQEYDISDSNQALVKHNKTIIELQQQQSIINERLKYQGLRKELLDRQENSINSWLSVVGIFLTFFGLLVPVGAWFFSRRVDKHIDEIKQLKDQAQEHVNDISGLKKLTAESVNDNPQESDLLINEASETGSLLAQQIAEAYQEQKEGDIKQALNKWHEILGISQYLNDKSLQARCYFNLGYLFAKDEQFYFAYGAFQKAIEISPEDDVIYYNIGVSCSKLERYSEAIEAYQKSLSINPKEERAYCNMGLSYLALGKNEAASNSYLKAIEINPKHQPAYLNLFELYLIEGREVSVQLITQFKQNFAENIADMMKFEMLEIFKNISINNKEFTREQQNIFNQKYDNIGFDKWGWKEIEKWIETKNDESKVFLQNTLDFFKSL